MLGPQLNEFCLVLLVLDQPDNISMRMLRALGSTIHFKIALVHVNDVVNALDRLLSYFIFSELVLPVAEFVSFLALYSKCIAFSSYAF